MPIAAVPKYLGQDFTTASPGMRFGMYLPIWTDRADQERDVRKRAEAKSREGQGTSAILQRQGMDAAIDALRNRERSRLPGIWDKNDFAAREAWKKVVALSPDDKLRVKGLLERQTAMAAASPGNSVLQLAAESVAPFTTGLGNEHPLENGFAFLNPYGLPYLPGSGVKGVLRQAARELASGDWGDPHGWSDKPLPSPASERGAGGEGLSMLDALFGRESGNGDTDHLRGALIFWDVIPQIEGDSLMVEIMTPHQGHYYQGKPAAGSTNPHDSGQPTPISFLTVPPRSRFVFHVTCDLAHLNRLAPELAENGKWKELLTSAFEHAFQWLGFGAKTAVGYGAMETEAQRRAREEESRKREARSREDARKAQEARQVAEAQPWPGARLKFNRNNGALTAEKDGRSAVAVRPKGEELLNCLPPEIRQKVLSNQFVRVTVYVSEGTLVRVETP